MSSISTNVGGPSALMGSSSVENTQTPAAASSGSFNGHSVAATANHRAPAADATPIGDKIKAFFSKIGDGFKAFGAAIAKPFKDLAANISTRMENKFQTARNNSADRALDPATSGTDKGKALMSLMTKNESRPPGEGIAKTLQHLTGAMNRMSAPDRAAAMQTLTTMNAPGGLRDAIFQATAESNNTILAALQDSGFAAPDGAGAGDGPHTAQTIAESNFGQALTLLGSALPRHLELNSARTSLFDGTASAELNALFDAHVAADYTSENIGFVRDVSGFNALMADPATTPAMAREAFNTIYDNRVDTGEGNPFSFDAQADINISGAQKSPLEALRNSAGDIPADAFQNAFTEIKSMVIRDTMPRFLASENVKTYVHSGVLP
jgi:hypothetical protein